MTESFRLSAGEGLQAPPGFAATAAICMLALLPLSSRLAVPRLYRTSPYVSPCPNLYSTGTCTGCRRQGLVSLGSTLTAMQQATTSYSCSVHLATCIMKLLHGLAWLVTPGRSSQIATKYLPC